MKIKKLAQKKYATDNGLLIEQINGSWEVTEADSGVLYDSFSTKKEAVQYVKIYCNENSYYKSYGYC